MNGSIYERELKSILEGDRKVVKQYILNLPSSTAKEVERIIDHPYWVVRAAGSFGVDLIAVRYQLAFPIEVKSSSSNILRFSNKKSKKSKQYLYMKEKCEKSGLFALYAFRLKGKQKEEPWRIFHVEKSNPTGINEILQYKIPSISLNSNHNMEMKWEEGMPLSEFIKLTFHLQEKDISGKLF